MGPPDPRASTLAHLSCSHIHLVDVGLKGYAMRLHPARVQPSFFLARSPKRKKDGDEPSKKKRWWVDASRFPKHTHTHFHTQVAKRKLREEIKETLNERKTNHIAGTFLLTTTPTMLTTRKKTTTNKKKSINKSSKSAKQLHHWMSLTKQLHHWMSLTKQLHYCSMPLTKQLHHCWMFVNT